MNGKADFARAQAFRVPVPARCLERHVTQSLLIGNRDRVVATSKVFAVCGIHPHREQMPRRLRSLRRLRQTHCGILNSLQIRRRDFSASRSPACQSRQTRPPKKSRLQLIQPAVVPDKVMPILGGLPIVAQSPHARVELRIPAQNRPHRPSPPDSWLDRNSSPRFALLFLIVSRATARNLPRSLARAHRATAAELRNRARIRRDEPERRTGYHFPSSAIHGTAEDQ